MFELSLLSPRGELVAQMTARDSVEAAEKIVMNEWVSSIGHALDIGKQLGWMDLALKYGFDFRQDNMPDLEAICGKGLMAKREVRSSSGAKMGDVRRPEDAVTMTNDNTCGPDGQVCEPAPAIQSGVCDPVTGEVCA